MIDTRIRPLNEVERRIVDIQHKFYLGESTKAFSWEGIRPLIVLIIVFAFLVIRFPAEWFVWIIELVMIIILITRIRSFFQDRKKGLRFEKVLSKIKDEGTLNITECQCERALFFPGYDDEGECYLLEVGKKQLLCYHVRYEQQDFFLPNDHISFYSEETVREILGAGFTIHGNRIAPTVIVGPIKLAIYDKVSFPRHLEVIDYSIEQYLDMVNDRVSGS